MAIDFKRDESTLIIQAAERVDSTNAQRFLEDLDAAIEPTDQVVILDMENLTYISSAGLRVILQTAKTLQRQSSGFALCTLSSTVREVFEISGFDQVISIHDTRRTPCRSQKLTRVRTPLISPFSIAGGSHRLPGVES